MIIISHKIAIHLANAIKIIILAAWSLSDGLFLVECCHYEEFRRLFFKGLMEIKIFSQQRAGRLVAQGSLWMHLIDLLACQKDLYFSEDVTSLNRIG